MNRNLGAILALTAISILAIQASAVEPDAEPLNLVAILTDFGTDDYYAGAMEGVIYAANPSARISVITYEIPPFNVAEGSYILAKSARWYPSGTVFLSEVNPGSGNTYRHIVLETKDGKLFVGPDNGLFTMVISDLGFYRAHEITNQSMTLNGSSRTFTSLHVFGPVAARLAAGLDPTEVGPEVDDLELLPFAYPELNGSSVTGRIVHVDSYGNLITNIPADLIEKINISLSDPLSVSLGNRSISAKFVQTYGDVPVGEWLALTGSSSYLEIAQNMMSAAETTGTEAGEKVVVSKGIRD